MSASDLPEPTIDQARQLGEKGSPARESERLLFEAWMGGHCWAIGGTWTGTQYKASDEDGLRVNQQAMLKRMLWAAWRDRGTLAADQLRAYGDKRAREAVPAGKLTRAEIDRVAHYAIESAILAPDDWEAAGLYDFAHAISGGIPVVDDLRTLVARLVRALRMVDPDSALPVQAMDYLMRHGLSLSPLRAAAPTPGDKTNDVA